MASVDVADETFLAVAPQRVAAALARPERWRRWWPDLRLTVHHDRGAEGLRWQVAGALTGSAEVWLEPVLDGTVLHYFLRGELDATPAAAAAEARRRRVVGKEVARELKRELEAGRAPGEPPVLDPPGGPGPVPDPPAPPGAAQDPGTPGARR